MPIEHVPLYPRVEGIPVLKDGKRIGTARMEVNGEVVITFDDPISRDIYTIVAEGFLDAFTFGTKLKPAEPIQIPRGQDGRKRVRIWVTDNNQAWASSVSGFPIEQIREMYEDARRRKIICSIEVEKRD